MTTQYTNTHIDCYDTLSTGKSGSAGQAVPVRIDWDTLTIYVTPSHPNVDMDWVKDFLHVWIWDQLSVAYVEDTDGPNTTVSIYATDNYYDITVPTRILEFPDPEQCDSEEYQDILCEQVSMYLLNELTYVIQEDNTMEPCDMERYYINITVGDAPMRVCYDRDNERLILVSVTDVQPHESVELLEGSAHDWVAKTNWATLQYDLEPVHYSHDEF